MMIEELVLASHNAGKLKELQAMLGAHIKVRSIAEFSSVEPEETGLSLVENAILKARHAARVSGLPALADDSGLAVDALGGAPGIYSARYAGGKDDAWRHDRPPPGRLRVRERIIPMPMPMASSEDPP